MIGVVLVPSRPQRSCRTSISGPADPDRGRVNTVEAAATSPTADIYFLVFDRYGSADAIDRRFGLENDLPDWLESQGFTVASASHANYRATDFSLAATLNMQFLDNLTAEIGPESGDRTPAQEMIQNHAVGGSSRPGLPLRPTGVVVRTAKSVTTRRENLRGVTT